jgi:hypothetical protein
LVIISGDPGPQAGSWKLEAGSRKLEAGSRKQEAGSRKQEAGSRKQEAGSRKRDPLLRSLLPQRGIRASRMTAWQ